MTTPALVTALSHKLTLCSVPLSKVYIINPLKTGPSSNLLMALASKVLLDIGPRRIPGLYFLSLQTLKFLTRFLEDTHAGSVLRKCTPQTESYFPTDCLPLISLSSRQTQMRLTTRFLSNLTLAVTTPMLHQF